MGVGIFGAFFKMSVSKFEEIYFSWYIVDRVCIIIFYKFLLLLKRVELMTSKQYTSMKQVLKSLKNHKKLEAIVLSINIIAIFIMIANIIIWANQNIPIEWFWRLNWARIIPQIVVFTLNTYTLYFFYKMVNYFLNDIFDNNHRGQALKFKCAVFAVLIIIIISNIRDNISICALQLNYQLHK